jgi:hypothetical protein
MKIKKAFAILLLLLSATLSGAAQPKQATLRAWDDYIRDLKMSMATRASGDTPFLELYDSPEVMQRVQRGEVVVSDHDPRKVPQGLIHHWIGAMFVPNVTIDQVIKVLCDYGHYSDFYSPLIKKSVVLERDGDKAMVTIVAVQKAFSVTAAVDTDNEVQVMRLAGNRLYIMTDAVRVQEVADYGQPNQHLFSEDRRPGYVWRSFVLQRIEARDGGVYIELETVALSRGIPLEVRWLIKPLTDQLPRRLMLDTLNETRVAVGQENPSSQSQGLSNLKPKWIRMTAVSAGIVGLPATADFWNSK